MPRKLGIGTYEAPVMTSLVPLSEVLPCQNWNFVKAEKLVITLPYHIFLLSACHNTNVMRNLTPFFWCLMSSSFKTSQSPFFSFFPHLGKLLRKPAWSVLAGNSNYANPCSNMGIVTRPQPWITVKAQASFLSLLSEDLLKSPDLPSSGTSII